MDQKTFINEVVKRGVHVDQIKECLRLQTEAAKAGREIRIWDLLIQKGYATRETVEAIIKPAGKSAVLGDFVLKGKLAEGFFQAVRKTGSQPVSLKLIPQNADNALIQQLEAESLVCASIEHPHLVRCLEFGQASSRWYCAMEAVDGRLLSRLVSHEKPLKEATALKVGAQIAGAIRALHDNGIGHGDVSARNILITSKNVPRLVKGGIAGDAQADIPALGATLFHLVTGAAPADAGADPRSMRPGLSEGCSSAIQALMGGGLDAAGAIGRLETAAAGEAPGLELTPSKREPSRPATPQQLAPPPPRRMAEHAPKKKSSPLLFVGIGAGALVLIVIGILVLASGGDNAPNNETARTPDARGGRTTPQPAVPAPAPPAPADEQKMEEALAGKIESLIRSGKLNEAVDALSSNEAVLGERSEGLLKSLNEAADKVWADVRTRYTDDMNEGRIGGAERAIKDFRTRAGKVESVRDRIEEALVEVQTFEKESKQKLAADRTFRTFEDAIRGFERNGVYGEAIGFLEGRLEISKDNPHLVNLIEERLAWLRTREEKKPTPAEPSQPEDGRKPSEILAKARDQFKQRLLEDALATLNGFLSRWPDHGEARSLRGHVNLDLDRRKEALIDAKAALQKDPMDGRSWYVIAALNDREGHDEEARKATAQAATTDPNFAPTYLLAARLQLKDGNADKAYAALAQAARIDPDITGTVDTIKLRIQIHEMKGKPQLVLEGLNEWIVLEPDKVEPFLKRAAIHLKAGNPTAAASDFASVLAMDPQNADALKGKEEADRALGVKKPEEKPTAKGKPKSKRTPKPRRKRKQKEVKPLAGSKLKQAVQGIFNAMQEQVKVLRDGRVQIILIYDFSGPKQFQDFYMHRGKPASRGIEMDADPDNRAGIALNALFEEDFTAWIGFKYEDDPTGGGSRSILRTNPSANPAQPGGGIGMEKVWNGQEWRGRLVEIGPAYQGVSKEVAVAVKSDGWAGLTLIRESTKITGYRDKKEPCEALWSGAKRYSLMFDTFDRVKVTGFQVQGFLDLAWIQKTLDVKVEGAPDMNKLLTGSDASRWNNTFNRPLSSGGDGVRLDSKGQIFELVHSDTQAAGNARYEMIFEVEEVYKACLFGLGLVYDGASIFQGEGSLMGRYGQVYSNSAGIMLETTRNKKPARLQNVAGDIPLQKGEYKIELIIEGTTLMVRVNGSLELKETEVVPLGKGYRISFGAQDVKGKIKSVVKIQ